MLGQVAAHHAAGAVAQKIALLVLRDLEFAVDREQLLRLDGEAGELVLGIAIVPERARNQFAIITSRTPGMCWMVSR